MDQRPLGGLALQLLRRLRIAMLEMPGLGRAGLQRGLAAVPLDGEAAFLRIDGGDGGGLAVGDADRRQILRPDDAVAGGELALLEPVVAAG